MSIRHEIMSLWVKSAPPGGTSVTRSHTTVRPYSKKYFDMQIGEDFDSNSLTTVSWTSKGVSFVCMLGYMLSCLSRHMLNSSSKSSPSSLILLLRRNREGT